tara:strand:- start:13 stop:1230 length:1218 start_codon:yes stop_codon:yes gene_type:complete
MASITETNQQYYQGAQIFVVPATATGQEFTTTFNTDLVFGSFDPAINNYALNNFKLYTSATGLPGSFTEYTSAYTVTNNTIKITGSLTVNNYVVVQLKTLDGGNYGNQDAFGTTVENNYGGYEYIKISDIVNNFLIAYVGAGKLILDVKRTDVIFHAKRGLQEFSYDTLKSVKSQELTIPPSLSVVLPQDYVNYVSMCYIDELGVKRPIYPANNLTTSPYENPIQDNQGVPTQDNFGDNLEGTSITEDRWKNANDKIISQEFFANFDDYLYWANYWGLDNFGFYGQQYGIIPQYAQRNGWFNPNYREGKMSFSSNLVGKLIVLEYISDGLAYDLDCRVPKMAEDALYAHILHSIISTRSGQQEYLVQRLRREKSAKLRNAKIRLSNIKLDEFVQVMRGKSKWIKH